ncbi:PLAT domain-containing protein 1-like [Henckelia pumila]|uniref:PLAT domain-containing protein 1-like n=1 Tax=Henckelia pumila TaxID=405737 RepID=UPI003C6DE787
MAIPQLFSLILLMLLCSCAAVSSYVNARFFPSLPFHQFVSFYNLKKILIWASYRKSNNIEMCIYSLNIRTGSVPNAGTHSKVSATLSDANGESMVVPNLEQWGPMDQVDGYFEKGKMDFFTGQGPCTRSPICRISVSSDGSGPSPGWFCDGIDVSTGRPDGVITRKSFAINQWVLPGAAVDINMCGQENINGQCFAGR